jgi:glycosyltransferase involved in cell wall biosynthesis
MVEIIGGRLLRNDTNEKAMGGTELMAERMARDINPAILKECHIVHSRVRDLAEDKIRVLVCHDLADDPENKHLENEGWRRFHRIVFCSNWQMQSYIQRYNIPWSRCIVMHNAIEPIRIDSEGEFDALKSNESVRLVYHTTPHRGLGILVPVFKKLAEDFDNVTLDVYSSFSVYGWNDRDKEYAALFKECEEHPRINYHGGVSNEEVRAALLNMHVYAYPSIWPETSCISLMEAMSAGLMCVHPNYAALYETAANWTHMYQWNEDIQAHANLFYSVLRSVVEDVRMGTPSLFRQKVQSQKAYADVFYDWSTRRVQWEALLAGMLNDPREIEQPKPRQMFSYVVQ